MNKKSRVVGALLGLFVFLPFQLAWAEGELDTSFGTNGQVDIKDQTLDISYVNAVSTLPNGKIIAVGGAFNSDFSSPFGKHWIYSSDGKSLLFDSGHAASGYYATYLTDVAVLENGKIILVGFVADNENHYDLFLTALDEDGNVYTGFGDNGNVVLDLGSLNVANASIAAQADGKVVVAGHAGVPNAAYRTYVARFNASNGTIDQDFATNGIWISPETQNHRQAYDVAVQGDRIAVVGGEQLGNEMDMFLIVFNTADGQLMNQYATDLLKPGDGFDYTSDVAYGVAFDSDGSIILAGHRYGYSTDPSVQDRQDVALVKYEPSGQAYTVSTDFGDYHKIIMVSQLQNQAQTVAVQSDGKILVGGRAGKQNPAPSGGVDYDAFLLRLESDGSLDSSFNNGEPIIVDAGHVFDNAPDVFVQDDGNILLAVLSNPSSYLYRYVGTPPGSSDSTGGATGGGTTGGGGGQGRGTGHGHGKGGSKK